VSIKRGVPADSTDDMATFNWLMPLSFPGFSDVFQFSTPEMKDRILFCIGSIKRSVRCSKELGNNFYVSLIPI
jgi:hypothetical protein